MGGGKKKEKPTGDIDKKDWEGHDSSESDFAKTEAMVDSLTLSGGE